MLRSTLASLLFALAATPLAAAESPETFFENHVRPLLHEKCNSCHGKEKQQGSVRLDRRSGVFGGPDSDPLVEAGSPEDSRLIQVIQYDPSDVQMPPSGKLSNEEIAILTRWVQEGAFWPEEAEANPDQHDGGIPLKADGTIDYVRAAETHWAYQPVTRPELPAAISEAASATEVDHFIHQKLSEAGLSPSPQAERATLIRRATFDLLGVPPTYEEVQAFVNDDQPGAWERLIERLLASPLYGQRWGRHWLDVARYATTKGYVFTQNPVYPFAYTYRDYVVDAFNADKPYDRFLLEQIAADKLELAADDPALAALGFLTVGPRYLNREPDIIDDRIDVVTRGTMGMTLACARCHDHKYDPLPTADYYALYGVFASSEEPESLPRIGEIEETPGYLAFKAEQDKRRKELEQYIEQARLELLQQARERVGDYLLAVAKAEGKLPDGTTPAYEHGTPRDRLIRRWTDLIKKRLQAKDPVFTPWGAFADLPADNYAAKARETLDRYRAEQESKTIVNPRVWNALNETPPASFTEFLAIYARLLREADAEWQALKKQNPEAERLPDDTAEQLRMVLYGPGSITDVPPGSESEIFERDNRDQISKLERKIDEWLVESQDAPAHAMVLLDRDQPREPVIFERGNPARRGDRVPRRTPLILTGGESRPYTQGSGRLELAQAIASSDNPLTARVLVNRVWNWHFGRGLVDSQSDFGQRSDPPTHPELLDWLAWTFMHEDDWSIKQLHRRIMLSQTYQQASAVERPECRKVDPENRLYWRMHRTRLEFEPMRDSLLAVAGKLNPALAGRPVDIEQDATGRRTIYAKIDRNNFSPLLRTFDYPSPDATSPGRPLTTVPQQALYAMNSDFLRETAIAVDQRAREQAGNPEDATSRIVSLYRIVLSRDPTANERELAQKFVQQHPDRWPLLAQTLLQTNEFLFID